MDCLWAELSWWEMEGREGGRRVEVGGRSFLTEEVRARWCIYVTAWTSVCAWGKRCLGGWILWNGRASRMSEGEWKVRLARDKEWRWGDAYFDVIERG